jgi:hypothetical protein
MRFAGCAVICGYVDVEHEVLTLSVEVTSVHSGNGEYGCAEEHLINSDGLRNSREAASSKCLFVWLWRARLPCCMDRT